jgi:hypothetical protein
MPAEEIARMVAWEKENKLTVIPGTVGRQTEGTGLDIVLRATAQLQANPAAVAAFTNAAARLERVIRTPVTVTMDVDYGTTRFGTPFSGPNVLGSTSSAIRGAGTTIRQFADSLKAKNTQYTALSDAIPDPIPNTSGAANLTAAAATANLQAIGLLPANFSGGFGQVPAIGFNSAFTFDLNPDDGITPGQTDFDGVAVHEMGHALGFVSVIGTAGFIYTWDLFRFRPGAVTNLATFNTAPRVNTPGPSSSGGDHVFWDGLREYELSTATGGRTGGDGQQASHWRDDAQRVNVPLAERKIGIMDPDIAAGVRDTMRLADLKALSILGWQVNLRNIIAFATNQRAFSDFTTPTSVALSWNNPTVFYDGRTLSDYRMVVLRNNTPITTVNNPTPGSLSSFTDNGLTEFTSYAYRIVPIHNASGDTGIAVNLTAAAGGSPRAGAGTNLLQSSNGSTVALRFTTPTRRADGTTLNNLARCRVFRNNVQIDSIALAPSDTGRAFVYVDTPPSRAIPAYTYSLSFVTSVNPPLNGESDRVSYTNTRGGVTNTANYTEGFETSRQSVVSNALWDSTNTLAQAGTFSLGALNYGANANASAFIPVSLLGTNASLSFQTICRTFANRDFGIVEISRNRGRAPWQTLLQLSAASRPEWGNNQNTWFNQSIPLSAYAGDTVLIRFRLTSAAGASGFGWLVDELQLNVGTLSAVTQKGTGIPSSYSLAQNYPNPFNPSTVITYQLPVSNSVTLEVFDMLGRTVATLVNQRQAAGSYSVNFNAAAFSSGVYFYKLTSGSFTETKKMLLVK